jgi:phage FluMu protein Com
MSELVDFRCPTEGCGRLLCKVASLPDQKVEARCPRCKQTVTARLESPPDKPTS